MTKRDILLRTGHCDNPYYNTTYKAAKGLQSFLQSVGLFPVGTLAVSEMVPAPGLSTTIPLADIEPLQDDDELTFQIRLTWASNIENWHLVAQLIRQFDRYGAETGLQQLNGEMGYGWDPVRSPVARYAISEAFVEGYNNAMGRTPVPPPPAVDKTGSVYTEGGFANDPKYYSNKVNQPGKVG